MADATRKQDAYRKIGLGGLVIKAGLGDIDKAVLLGLLIEGARGLDDGEQFARLRAVGAAAFKEDADVKRCGASLDRPAF